MPKILVVDGDDSSRDILKMQLEGTGATVLELGSGEEVLQTAKTTHPDLIFLDVMMPQVNGWKICQLLKADSETSRIPVMMLTAGVQQSDELRSWESGADGYLTKSREPERVIREVREFLPSQAGNLA